MASLTDYQKAQLLYFSLNGTFKYTNAKGNKVSRQAWLAMLKAFRRTSKHQLDCP